MLKGGCLKSLKASRPRFAGLFSRPQRDGSAGSENRIRPCLFIRPFEPTHKKCFADPYLGIWMSSEQPSTAGIVISRPAYGRSGKLNRSVFRAPRWANNRSHSIPCDPSSVESSHVWRSLYITTDLKRLWNTQFLE